MSGPNTDHDLLIGIQALQLNFISRNQLLDAIGAREVPVAGAETSELDSR